MNQVYYNKKRYTSFILSIILHILLLLLLFIALKVHQTTNVIFDNQEYNQQNAAKVTFQTKQMALPVGPMAPIIPNLPIAPIAPPAQQKQTENREQNNINLPPNNITQEKAVNLDESINRSESLTQSENEQILDNHNGDNANIDDNSQQNSNEDFNKSIDNSKNIIRDLPKKNVKRRKAKITAAQIFRAFNNIYQKEQAQQAKIYSSDNNLGYYSNSSNQIGSGGSIFENSGDQERSRVQDRADEWKIHQYQNKVLRAIAQAASLYSKDFYSNEDIETIIRPKLVIDKEGKISPISADQLTGNERVDKELLRFLNSAEIPGIPKNFDSDTYIFTLNFKITLKKGINKIYITTGW